MTPVRPNLVLDGYEEKIYAENQPEYLPLPVIRSVDETCRVISRWQPTPEERERIAAGEDIFLEMLTFRNALQPVMLHVGEPLLGK